MIFLCTVDWSKVSIVGRRILLEFGARREGPRHDSTAYIPRRFFTICNNAGLAMGVGNTTKVMYYIHNCSGT